MEVKMTIRTIILIATALIGQATQAEVCEGIPTRPTDPRVIELPCKMPGWMLKEFPGEFELCLPDDLVMSPLGHSNSPVNFEREDLFVLIDYSQYADNLMHYKSKHDYREWASVWWEPTWTKFVSFTSETDVKRPYRIASFIPNIDRSLHLNIFVYAKNCDGVRQGRDLLRSVSIIR